MKTCTSLAAAVLMLTAALSPVAAEKPDAAGPAVNTLTAAEEKEGWKLLFDGKTLKGWRRYNNKDAAGWTVKDSAIYLEKSGSGDLMTAEKYGDFELSVDWKFEKGNNSGVLYRVIEEKGPPYNSGPEMQVMTHKAKEKLGKNSAGSLYDMYAPTSNTLKQADEWNTFKVVARGKHLEHWVNGVKVVECDIGSEDWNKRYAASKWKKLKQYAAAPRGHISLQDHGAKILFRNIKLRVLDSK